MILIDDRSVQSALQAAGLYRGIIDGDFGIGSKRAARELAARRSAGYMPSWPDGRVRLAVEQAMFADAGFNPGVIDGLMGQDTKIALEGWQNRLRDVVPSPAEVAHQPSIFPRQGGVPAFYGPPGTGHTSLALPYPMRIAWDPVKTVNRITIHSKCAASAGRALSAAKDHYGYEKLKALGLDLFGGCFANRPMRGGRALSMHAYACAIDFNPEQNQLRWGRDRAAMAKPECAAFLDAFQAQGWISLGRERNFDWMHVQAARL